MSAVTASDGTIYWRQLRSDQGGGYDLLRLADGEEPQSLLPSEFSARSRVHEYGGGEYTVHQGIVYFCNDEDQRIYRLEPGSLPIPLSPLPDRPGSLRYADARVEPGGGRLVAVCERHSDSMPPLNQLVALATEGPGEPIPLAAGHDFYASPRFDISGARLCFLTWDLPQMPWDGTGLWVATMGDDGQLERPIHIAGDPTESICQPTWGPDDQLYFVSDRNGWWNLYRWDGQQVEPLAPMQAELGSPAWVFGLSRYDFLGRHRVAFISSQDGVDRLGLLNIDSGKLTTVELPFTAFNPPHLRALDEGTLVFLASSPRDIQALYRLDLETGETEKLHQPGSAKIDDRYISIPESISFPSEDDQEAHAIFYPPHNGDYQAPEGESPPLIVTLHGGPTSAASLQLHLETQFWTSRGFAVADLNYSGSTGYGRPYRQRLNGRWGQLDVLECVRLAEHLAEEGRVDGRRLLIHGGSAGGFTTLAALTFHNTFAAGACYYGVADAEALAKHSHKFEARYLDALIAPYPDGREVYWARSPIRHTDQLNAPLILFQGTDDPIVPPEQARRLAAALEQKGVTYAYLEFEGEGHGFEREATIERVLAAELGFYSRLFGFELPEQAAPVEIHNLED